MRLKSLNKSKYILTLFYACSFVLPVLLYLVVYMRGSFWPFGDRSVLICDLKDQLAPFISYIRYAHDGGNSGQFTWSSSLGSNYYALHAYYLNSPLNLITLLFPVSKIPQAIAVLTVLKSGLMGVTFSVLQVYLFKKHFKSVDVRIFAYLPLTIAYVFTIYNFYYAMHLMWFESLILLPIIIIGIEEIFEGKKGLLYLLSLIATFFCNYYTGYMVGIFSALYFVSRVLMKLSRKDIKKLLTATLRYFLMSVTAICFSSPLLAGVLTNIMGGKVSDDAFFVINEQHFYTFKEFISVLTSSDYVVPSVRTGWFEAVLVIAFFILPNIRIREKIVVFLFHAFMILGFYSDKLVLMWHCFRMPMTFYFRNQFLFNFLFVLTAVRALCATFELADKKLSDKKKTIIGNAMVITGVFAVILFTECIELGKRSLAIMGNLDIKYGFGYVSEFEEYVEKTEPLIDTVRPNGPDFYRINLEYLNTKNDTMLMGFSGLQYFTSTYSKAVNDFLQYTGFARPSVLSEGYESNPVTDGLFSVRYTVSDRELGEYYSLVSDTEGLDIYENPHTAGLIWSADVTSLSPELIDWDTYGNINRVLDCIDGDEAGEYFTEIPGEVIIRDPDLDIVFTAESSDPVYLHMINLSLPESTIYVNGEKLCKYFTERTTKSICIGRFEPGTEVVIHIVSDNGTAVLGPIINLCYMDEEKVTSLMDEFSSNSAVFSEFDNGKIKGKIVVPEGNSIITSIPYDEGWSVYVDGTEIDVSTFANAFIAFDVSVGEHSIELSYHAPGVRKAYPIMFVSVAFALFYFLKKSRVE